MSGGDTFRTSADAYDRHVGRYGAQLAAALIEFAGVAPGMRVLDVGSGPGALTAALAERVGVANVAAAEPSEPFAAACRVRVPGVEVVVAAAEALPFADDAFDLYFSNAVIEHVGGEERQRAFVAEALRVARRVFLTTPNRWFPIEVHTRLPLVHWLPERAAARAYDVARRPWAKDNRLLGPAELRRLFPVPVRIVNLGMTLVAIT